MCTARLCILHFLDRFWIFQMILRSVQRIWGFSSCKKVWDSDLLRLSEQLKKKNNMQLTNNYIWELKIQKCMLKCWIFPRNAEKIQKSEVQSLQFAKFVVFKVRKVRNTQQFAVPSQLIRFIRSFPFLADTRFHCKENFQFHKNIS